MNDVIKDIQEPDYSPVTETYSGAMVSLVDPEPFTIDIEDIARHLSKISRYNGATRTEHGYSVAQHSAWVAAAVEVFLDDPEDTGTVMCALLHDAHEAYMGDITRPLKSHPGLGSAFKLIERRLDIAIFVSLNVPMPLLHQKTVIKQADNWALALEARRFMYSGGCHWDLPAVPDLLLPELQDAMSPDIAYHSFMAAFEIIQNGDSLMELWK